MSAPPTHIDGYDDPSCPLPDDVQAEKGRWDALIEEARQHEEWKRLVHADALEVHHLDGNPHNNELENLQIVNAPPRPWLRTPPTLEDVLAASLLDAYGRCQYCGSDDEPCQCWEAVAEREADANDAALDRAREEGRA